MDRPLRPRIICAIFVSVNWRNPSGKGSRSITRCQTNMSISLSPLHMNMRRKVWKLVKTYRLENLSCTNCAAKFEKNIRNLPDIKMVELNFGASKLTVDGNVSIEALEKAGAFDHIRVYPEKSRIEHTPFYKRRQTVETAISFLLLVAGVILSFQTAENNPWAIGLFGGSMLVGGYHMFRTGLVNLSRVEFDMKTLMTIAVIGAAIIGE